MSTMAPLIGICIMIYDMINRLDPASTGSLLKTSTEHDGEELRADIGDRDNCLARLVTENVERTEPLGYIAAARNTTVNKIAAARKTTSIQCAERDFQARKVLQLEDKMWMLQVQLDFAVNRHIGCTQLKDQAACIDLVAC
ncbi:hypothetical protein FRB96_001083 [Tulasnella sp. 330]|nr:hypothetical protein FRB96_001083 [Tulasnella sp. 330]